ncbi:MAG TPA: DUF350 domain-containing protein, partial [Nocardioidaceae bacterium]|nr:DUF350 domain-containing protein [Nocardioidaceae bacterium]
LLVLGYYAIDLLTPGKLGHLVFLQRNRDAAYLLASGLAAIGMIAAMAIWTSEGGFLTALAATVAYGLLGIALLALSYLVLDWVTPGNLGEILTDEHHDPAVWVKVVTQLSLGLIVVAALS